MITYTQQGWYIEKKGLENLMLANNVPILKPSGFEVSVKVLSAGLNPVDWKRCEYEIPNIYHFPGYVGLDGFGIVLAVGEQVLSNKFIPGQSIVYFHCSMANQNRSGTFQQYALADSRGCSIIKQSILEKNNINKLANDLVSLICTGWTAYQIVVTKLKFDISSLNKVQNIVVTAGAGGVGACCIQLLNIYRMNLQEPFKSSFKIITTCCESNFEYVKSLGATHPIDYKKQNIEEQVQLITGNNGTDAWIDLVGKQSAQIGLKNLAYAGELVVVVRNPDYDAHLLFQKALTIHNVSLGSVYFSGRPELFSELQRIGDLFQQFYEQGYIKPLRYTEIKLEDVKSALLELKDGKNKEKYIVKIANF